jgi:tetratricopeptide (TPR) repeat protein
MPWIFCLAATFAPLSAAADSPGPSTLLAQGRARQAVAEYGEAADAYERFARESPDATDARQALQDAVVMRIGLGDTDKAQADTQLFVRAYGAKDPALAARVGLALPMFRVDHEDWVVASKSLEAWVASFDGTAPLDARIEAHAALGRAFVRLNNGLRAEPEYAKVVALWKDPAAAAHTLELEGADQRRLARAITAVGEALFFFAEQKRKEVDRIQFPEYRGPGIREDLLKHVNTKVKDWVAKKRPAIDGAEQEYRKIVDIKPVPPPRWVIAAASRVGHMWGKFVAEFRAAPIPREWKGNGPVPGAEGLTYVDLRREWYGKLDESSAPQKQVAKAAFETCVSYSVKFQYDDAYARSCRNWLSKNYESEYPQVDEFRPGPAYLGSAGPLAAPLADPR